MRLHYLQHVPFEDAAAIGDWARDRGHYLSCTRLYDGQMLPAQSQFDWLIIMGGPMNIYQHDKHPWLPMEKEFIRHTIDAGKKVIGVCLGAQLIADVLGGPVRPHRHKEIGWYPVSLTEEGRRCRLFSDWPDRIEAFHWHGDTFRIPPGAVHVATSEGCWNQGFIYGERVVGLQFHMEYTTESIRKMLTYCADEIAEGPYIQSALAIEEGFRLAEPANDLICCLLDALEGVPN